MHRLHQVFCSCSCQLYHCSRFRYWAPGSSSRLPRSPFCRFLRWEPSTLPCCHLLLLLHHHQTIVLVGSPASKAPLPSHNWQQHDNPGSFSPPRFSVACIWATVLAAVLYMYMWVMSVPTQVSGYDSNVFTHSSPLGKSTSFWIYKCGINISGLAGIAGLLWFGGFVFSLF